MTVYAAEQLHQDQIFDETKDTASMPRMYSVFTNVISTSEIDILKASGLPQIYDLLPGSDVIMVRRRSGKKEAPVTIDGVVGARWIITCYYELTNDGNDSNQKDDTTGLNSRLINFSIDFNVVIETIEKAYDSDGMLTVPIKNTAGQAIDMKEEKYNMILRWTQKEDTCFNYASVSGYIGTTNANPITILGINIASNCGLFRKINPTYKYDQILGVRYFETAYEVEINKESFIRKPKSAGFRQLNVDGELTDIINNDITPNSNYASPNEGTKQIKEPAELDKNGHVILPALKLDPYYLEFKTKRSIPWSGFHLVSSIY